MRPTDKFWAWEGVKAMDAGVIAAIIGSISAVGGIVLTAFLSLRSYRQQKLVDHENYAAQKAIDRKIELRNRRMKDYEHYLTALRGFWSLYDFGRNPADDSKETIEAVNEVRFAYSSLFQIASDPVLTAVIAFHKVAWSKDTDLTGEAFYHEFRRLYAHMIVEMRKDAFEKTQLRTEVVEKNVPYDRHDRRPNLPATDEQEPPVRRVSSQREEQ